MVLTESVLKHDVKWGPIGEQVYKRSYSRVKEDGTNETWPETVLRAVKGNLGLVAPEHVEPDEEFKLVNLMLDFGIIPAGRHLYASGVKGRQFLFNCHAAGWDGEEPEAHFTFLFDQLMQGGGVGSNYSNRYLEKMPPILRSIDLHITCRKDHPNLNEFENLLCTVSTEDLGSHWNRIIIEDSREGWVDAVGRLFQAAFEDKEGDAKIVIDVSQIRARGLPLKTSGGIACGPGPLVTMLHDLVKHINGCYGRRFSSEDAMSLDHTLAACVIAGGKRRSSRMSVKNWKDHDIFEFINCKRNDGVHWTTNISVEIDNDFLDQYAKGSPHAHDVMRAVILGKRSNGEPGFWNIDYARKGERNPKEMFCPNPCGEIGLQMWENCCLGHVNLQYFATKPMVETKEAFRLMSRWLVRATFGDIPQSRQRAVVNRNRRIGVGFFGFHGWLALRGIKYSECWKNEDVKARLSVFHSTVAAEAKSYAAQLGIDAPVKNTALAPTGTIVLMPGVSGSGQAMMYDYFKRLVRYASTDPELAVKKAEGYHTFPDPDAAHTEIVEYWCEDPLVALLQARGWNPEELLECQEDISLSDALHVQAMLQEQYADNAISFTVNMPEDKMPSEEEMEKTYANVLHRVKGTTFFPAKSRKNAPYQKVSKAEWDAYPGQKEVTQVEEECVNGCPIR